jgi:hypothetical protein
LAEIDGEIEAGIIDPITIAIKINARRGDILFLIFLPQREHRGHRENFGGTGSFLRVPCGF